MRPVIELGFRDPAFHLGDAQGLYRRWRAEDPVRWDAASSMWLVTRHADVVHVSRNPALFCSGRGVLLGDRDREFSAAESILYLDPPLHSRYRRIVATQFHGDEVARLRDRIRRLARELLDGVEPGAAVDAVATLAVPLPLVLIAELLGVPGSDRNRFHAWSEAAMRSAVTPDLAAHSEIVAYFVDAIRQRRREPRQDLVSQLLVAQVDGERLSTAEVLGFCISLLVAGNETTRHLLSGGLGALSRHPEQWRRLRDQPGLVSIAVEEMLRWVTPFNGFARTATAAVELGGRHVAEGDYVFMVYASANRDESVFGDSADRFDVARQIPTGGAVSLPLSGRPEVDSYETASLDVIRRWRFRPKEYPVRGMSRWRH